MRFPLDPLVPTRTDRRSPELALHLVDQLLVEVEVPAQELDDDQEVPAAVGEASGGLLCLVEPFPQVGRLFESNKEALSQLQMLYVKETDERAKARAKIWTPGQDPP